MIRYWHRLRRYRWPALPPARHDLGTPDRLQRREVMASPYIPPGQEFEELLQQIEEEAKAQGPQSVLELRTLQAKYRGISLGLQHAKIERLQEALLEIADFETSPYLYDDLLAIKEIARKAL